MSIEWITILMFGCLALLLFSGFPIGFATGSLAVIFSIAFWGPPSLYIISEAVFNWMNAYTLVAVPMFIFMATILASSGLVDHLFDAVYLWAGPLRGGLALVTIVVSTVMASMVGIIGATEVTMGLVALPAMLKRGYGKGLATGCVCAGGALGYLIPPSVLFILYGMTVSESVGQLFMGGILPGLLLSGLYMIYIVILSYVQPHVAPPMPEEERRMPLSKKLNALKHLVLPAFLILSVLGSIYLGLASITEASGIGALGALLCGLIQRQLTLTKVRQATYQTIRITSMVVWLCIGSSAFISVYTGAGGTDFAAEFLSKLPLGPWGTLICIQLFLIFLGCFIDWVGIMMLTVPIFVPVIKSLGFDPLWYGILFNVNMQIAQLTPPFGMALFYLKGVAPKEVSISDIYRGIWPFILLQLAALALIMIFPEIALWLPRLMMKTN